MLLFFHFSSFLPWFLSFFSLFLLSFPPSSSCPLSFLLFPSLLIRMTEFFVQDVQLPLPLPCYHHLSTPNKVARCQKNHTEDRGGSVVIRSAAITNNFCIRLSVDFHPPAISHKNSIIQMMSKAFISTFGGGRNQEYADGIESDKGFSSLCSSPVLTSLELESAK